MKRFYENFSETEKDFIVKEFISWQKQGYFIPEDGDVEKVMELALSKEFASREDTVKMVYNALEEFNEMEFTEEEE